MSIKIEEESVYLKYAKIWNKIKSILNVKFHSQPIHDDKYIKAKVKTFNNTINTLFSGDERIHYVCISAICTDSVLTRQTRKITSKFIWNNASAK